MNKGYLSIQEVAEKMGKSAQTIRRMIKRGDLKAQRIKSPQGFRYVLKLEDLGISSVPSETVKEPEIVEEEMCFQSPIQNVDKALGEELNDVLISQNEILINQSSFVPHVEVKNEPIDENRQDIFEQFHKEKMFLIRIIERLQAKLDRERRRPKSFLAHIMEFLLADRH
jgi:excisionase family DNA binding protein